MGPLEAQLKLAKLSDQTTTDQSSDNNAKLVSYMETETIRSCKSTWNNYENEMNQEDENELKMFVSMPVNVMEQQAYCLIASTTKSIIRFEKVYNILYT